ncbi:MAG: cation transporter [Candidatus Lindowbacteria bacterium RIFCSPLOWO2_02_FULL_62_12]|nr:MAG: cation transporter [Candidatus Lindowbacteria bacterium RIFCSPLOWO2_02_FULL_62_12]
MIERLIAWCARNRFIVFTLTIFFVLAGLWSLQRLPLDAIPDLSDVQVIILTEWDGRSPDLVEDQITYPIVTSLLSAPKVQFVRGQSLFDVSFVYVVFEEGTDMYWARSRVLEYLNQSLSKLPAGVRPSIGPDATGVGWVFEYALVDESGKHDLSELRSFQDWNLRYALASVEGVAEVASIGGFVKQYQVEVDPNALLAYDIPLKTVIDAIRRSNNDVGGRVLEIAEREYMIRGRGYVRSTADLEKIPVAVHGGTPVLLGQVARIHLGPDMRRGVVELDGKGEAVGGLVIMRYGENALNVIARVKDKLKSLEASMPEGVRVVVTYDRSTLINAAIHTLKNKLTEEMIVVALVILFFLWHVRSSLIPIVTLPVAVILGFIPMYYMGITASIMSLGGIAIAVGAMVDASIVIIENTHKRLETWNHEGRQRPAVDVLIESAQEVGPSIFFSLLVIAVSFMPIFTLEAQEGRLFKPLAFTKNFSMAFAALVAITLAPALLTLFLPGKEYAFASKWKTALANLLWGGKFHSEETHPVSRFLHRLYDPCVTFVLKHRRGVILAAVALMLISIPIYFQLGSEFMPPLWEGTFLYMPTGLPGMSITQAGQVLHSMDKIIMQFPEVEHVFGKIGRFESATDPAPIMMVESIITLKPMHQWRPGVTVERLKEEMDAHLQFPGMPNVWWMPIQTRIEMLTTGVRSPVGIKVMGADLEVIQQTANGIEAALKDIRGTRSVFAERVTGGNFIDFEINRSEAARYGLQVAEVEEIIETAIGGANVATTIEGRERYPINVRYPRDFRDDLDKLSRVKVATPTGAQVPIGQFADIRFKTGPSDIRNEDGSLATFIFIDVKDRDLGGYVEEAQRVIQEKINLPPGVRLEWAGQFRYLERAKAKLVWVVPLTLFVIFLLLYLNTKSAVKTAIVMLAVPFSLIGAFWLLWVLDYNMSVAVWVGLLALAGVDAETGVIMLLYLEMAYADRVKSGRMKTQEDLDAAIREGAVKRIRPKLMTVGTTFMGLLPIMWAGLGEAGADVMKRIAAPMVGGIFSSFLMELLVYPAIYSIWKGRLLKR